MPEQRYRRTSLRYPDYDYSQPGAVFVTINTHNHQRLFGCIAEGQMRLSPQGRCVHEIWESLPERFPDILLVDCVVMPDHFHGIIVTGTNPDESARHTVGFVIASFKNQVAAAWRRGVVEEGGPGIRESSGIEITTIASSETRKSWKRYASTFAETHGGWKTGANGRRDSLLLTGSPICACGAWAESLRPSARTE